MDELTKNKAIGRRIRQAREAAGMTQEELAEDLDTKPATVSRWESGSFPKRIGLPKIAAALNKPVDWFYPADAEVIDRIVNIEKIISERASDSEDKNLQELRVENEDLKKQIAELKEKYEGSPGAKTRDELELELEVALKEMNDATAEITKSK